MIALIIVAAIVVVVLIILLYANKAFPEAQAIADKMDREGRDYWFYGDSGVGFIIFAGAKTRETAYAYLAELLRREGHTVVIPYQPFAMSAFGARHGQAILDEHPDIKKWILIGHSLGGMPAARIAAASPKRLIGIVFLATYASSNLAELPFPALRISADHDGIMNNTWMDTYAKNLPAGSKSIMLEGANHVGFGAYKSSGRDGKATMTWQEQNETAIRLTLDFYKDSIREAEKD